MSTLASVLSKKNWDMPSVLSFLERISLARSGVGGSIIDCRTYACNRPYRHPKDEIFKDGSAADACSWLSSKLRTDLSVAGQQYRL